MRKKENFSTFLHIGASLSWSLSILDLPSLLFHHLFPPFSHLPAPTHQCALSFPSNKEGTANPCTFEWTSTTSIICYDLDAQQKEDKMEMAHATSLIGHTVQYLLSDGSIESLLSTS